MADDNNIVRFRKKKKAIKLNQKQRRVIIMVLCIVAIIGFVLFEIARKNIL